MRCSIRFLLEIWVYIGGFSVGGRVAGRGWRGSKKGGLQLEEEGSREKEGRMSCYKKEGGRVAI